MDIKTRLEKIQTVEDAENQIRLAKAYAIRLRNEAKNVEPLQDKLALQKKVKAAELTLRQIRRLIFDVEDALIAGKPAISVFHQLETIH